MSGISIYYVDSASVTPDEPQPGIYFAIHGEPHGPYSTREEAWVAWERVRNEPPPEDDEFILQPRGDVAP